jgi:type IV pilus assembly protein PilB
MNLSETELKEILVKGGFLAPRDFEQAVKLSAQENLSLLEVLVEGGYITDEHLGQLIAQKKNYKYVNLATQSIDEKVLRIIPEITAAHWQTIIFRRDGAGLHLAMADPENLEITRHIHKKTGEEINIYYATPTALKNTLTNYRKEIKEEFNQIIEKNIAVASSVRPEDLPIVKITDAILDYAYENKASDIHIEPHEKIANVRYRIDGILHEVLQIPQNINELIIARLKILARLRTDEHQSAQDGKLKFSVGRKKIDVRVSVVPIINGEKVVLRILSEKARQFALEDLGLIERDLKKIRQAIKSPWGMILATGPTGCGKTTTLYAILKILNTPEVNISTIEDPVEYDIEGVNQIQVNPKTNLTFASGLRAIVRQDPNIIMVGEIRDQETADIAVNSAMTGHLVLSTLHTNDAPTTLPRLLDMGIEPFLVASTVNIAIGQRLVRKICSRCIESYQVEKKELAAKFSPKLIERVFSGQRKIKIRLYRGKGCKLCSQTGYLGRVGIFEVLEMSEKIKKLIMKRASTDEIRAQALKEGLTEMIDDGLIKALAGITTLDEILRVTRE